YWALVAGRSVQDAFDYGKSILGLADRTDADAIVLHVRDGADAGKPLFESTTRAGKPNLNSILERVVHGPGNESDWSNLQQAIETGALEISQRQVADWDDQDENMVVR